MIGSSRLRGLYSDIAQGAVRGVTRPLSRSASDGEARLRQLVTDLEREFPSAAACLAEDLPALSIHLDRPRSYAALLQQRRECIQ